VWKSEDGVFHTSLEDGCGEGMLCIGYVSQTTGSRAEDSCVLDGGMGSGVG